MKNGSMNILLLFFMLFACSDKAKENKDEPLSGPHSEITIQYTSQEIQSIQTNLDVNLNGNLIHILQSDTIIQKALLATGKKKSESEVDQIKNQLRFESVEETQIIQIQFYHSDESFANGFLKNLVEALSLNLLEETYNKANSKIRKVEEELDSAKLAMLKIEEKMVDHPNLNNELKRQEEIYLHLVEQRVSLTIEKAGIVNRIKIIEGPIYKRE